MKSNKLVYLAGPITIGNCIHHTHRALMIAEELIECGFVAFVPQLSIFWEFLRPHDHDWWLQYDRVILERCDALLRIPGESKGADEEVAFAIEHRIPVYYSVDELVLKEGN